MTEIRGVHPYADKFPMLPDAELDELAESIRSVGLLHPVVVTPDGLILDGRNRLEACNRAEVEASTEVYDGTDLAEYVIACNVTRRNMSTGARAMATALVLRDAYPDWRDASREAKYGVMSGLHESVQSRGFRTRVVECMVVLDFLPDLAASVVAGTLALDNAYQDAKAIKDSAERDKILARERRKRENAQDAYRRWRNAFDATRPAVRVHGTVEKAIAAGAFADASSIEQGG